MPSFKPPQLFNFREPQGWPEWRSQFQRFQTASELPDKSGEVQVSSLIYSMGPEATVPSSPRQSSVLLQIGGTSAMSPAAPTIHKAMVLRSERWRPSKRSSGRTTSSLPFCPTAQPPFPTSELALLSWLWEESSEPPCHHCHRRSSHKSLVTRKCESVTQSWSGIRRKTTIVAMECSLSRN